MRRIIWCVVAAVAALVSGVKAYTQGDGTAYSGDYEKDVTGFNSCQFGKLADYYERFYCALPSHVFDRKKHCGRCIKVRGTEGDAPGDWVKMMIVDECASCRGDGDVDMSKRALLGTTGYSWDRKRIEWAFTDCDTDIETRSKKRKEKCEDDEDDGQDDDNDDQDEEDEVNQCIEKCTKKSKQKDAHDEDVDGEEHDEDRGDDEDDEKWESRKKSWGKKKSHKG